MDPPAVDVEHFPEKIADEKEGGPSFHCGLYDTEVVHKIAQAFLPGLATACVDNTTGDIFRSPGSVAADIRKEMIDYLTERSETFVAEHIVLEGGSEVEASSDPLDIISDFIDDFATSKRNLFSRVSGWLLSERREDNIDDFAQEMEINGFWLMDHREAIAQTLLKNVDFKNSFHCKMNFKTEEELAEHVENCGYRWMHCENEGCTAVFCANQMENHDTVCPFKIIPCEQNCSESIMRREMDRHCITVCPMKLVNCPFYAVGCVTGVPQRELQQHRLDHLSSHLMYVLCSIYKEASADDLKPRVEQIQQLSTRLAEARDARSLTHLVKDIDPKLGPLVIKPKEEVNQGEKDTTDSTAVVSEETEKKVLELEVGITGKVEDEKSEAKNSTVDSPEQTETKAPEVDAKESENGLADVMEEAVKKVSEGEMKSGARETGGLKAQEAQDPDGTNRKGEETNNSTRLSDGTETNAREVMAVDEDSEEASEKKDFKVNVPEASETRGLEVKVPENIDEKGTERENSRIHLLEDSETEAPTTIVLDKKDEEGTQTMNSMSRASQESITEAPPTIVMHEKDGEGTQTMNSTTHAAEVSKTEAPAVIVLDKADDEGTQAMNSTAHTSTKAETEVSPIIVMDKADEVGTQTRNSMIHLSGEAETRASMVTSTD